MNPVKIKEILNSVKNEDISINDAMEKLAVLPYSDIGHAVLDNHRALRTGFPEVVLGLDKTAEQILKIILELKKNDQNILLTRIEPLIAEKIQKEIKKIEYNPVSRTLVLKQEEIPVIGRGIITILTAGTSDIFVAEEAAVTARLMGNKVKKIFDVGVAGIHRLFDKLKYLRKSSVIIVAAGMEGALASVVGGLVSCPIIAVPVSTGYGTSFKGITALLGMLNSCAAGVTVVNIDNGFGAGYAASLINRE